MKGSRLFPFPLLDYVLFLSSNRVGGRVSDFIYNGNSIHLQSDTNTAPSGKTYETGGSIFIKENRSVSQCLRLYDSTSLSHSCDRYIYEMVLDAGKLSHRS